MFKGMPKIFWIGTGLMYCWMFLFMILEMTVPGLPLKKIFGIPACYLYNWFFGLWFINVFISFLFYWSEEKREEKIKQKGGAI